MSTPALALLVLSAALHATWNYLAKRTGAGVVLVPLVAAVSAVVYLPVALAVVAAGSWRPGGIALGFIAGTAVLHTGYFTALQRGYERSDLSLVYPLARGTGPLFATLGAVVLLGERPGGVALLGIGLVAAGAIALSAGGMRARRRTRAGLAYGILTGVLIACYTIWDKHAVSGLAIPPLVYEWGNDFGRTLLTTPIAARHRAEACNLWRTARVQVVAIGVLSTLAYLLVLGALRIAPLTFVAPVREISIVFGTALGTQTLAEGHTALRMASAVAILGGVVALALA